MLVSWAWRMHSRSFNGQHYKYVRVYLRPKEEETSKSQQTCSPSKIPQEGFNSTKDICGKNYSQSQCQQRGDSMFQGFVSLSLCFASLHKVTILLLVWTMLPQTEFVMCYKMGPMVVVFKQPSWTTPVVQHSLLAMLIFRRLWTSMRSPQPNQTTFVVVTLITLALFFVLYCVRLCRLQIPCRVFCSGYQKCCTLWHYNRGHMGICFKRQETDAWRWEDGRNIIGWM